MRQGFSGREAAGMEIAAFDTLGLVRAALPSPPACAALNVKSVGEGRPGISQLSRRDPPLPGLPGLPCCLPDAPPSCSGKLTFWGTGGLQHPGRLVDLGCLPYPPAAQITHL